MSCTRGECLYLKLPLELCCIDQVSVQMYERQRGLEVGVVHPLSILCVAEVE